MKSRDVSQGIVKNYSSPVQSTRDSVIIQILTHDGYVYNIYIEVNVNLFTWEYTYRRTY